MYGAGGFYTVVIYPGTVTILKYLPSNIRTKIDIKREKNAEQIGFGGHQWLGRIQQ